MNIKSLLFGILAIIVIGFGGLVYRNAVEHPTRPIACPLDAQVCPDGTAVMRTGNACTFPACPPPNITLSSIGISFAVPDGFEDAPFADDSIIAAYALSNRDASSTTSGSIALHRYTISASSTALATIQATAINNPSGLPVSATALTSTVLGTHRFTVVTLERFEGTIDTAYYLARATDVLRFDAIDSGIANWTDAHLDLSTLPAHAALIKLLTTLQGE